jgi:hemin uptake protein HemP
MERDKPEAPAPRPAEAVEPAAAVVRISSQQLLAGAKEVLIEHHGTLYRLRQTALGKLILTK